MSERPGPQDPSMHGGQTADPGDDHEFDAEIIAAAEAVVDLESAEPAESEAPAPAEVDPALAARMEIQRNLHSIWVQADTMAKEVRPDAELMYSGVTTTNNREGTVSKKMARTFDIYRTPDGAFIAYMGRFLPGTEYATPVPCEITGFRQLPESPGDYEIRMTNHLVFDTQGRPLDVVLSVATELPRALADPDRNPNTTPLRGMRRTSLYSIGKNDSLGIFNVANPLPSSLRPPRWGRKPIVPRKTMAVSYDTLLTDLGMIEARDIQVQLGEDPPYRKGFYNVGDANVK